MLLVERRKWKIEEIRVEKRGDKGGKEERKSNINGKKRIDRKDETGAGIASIDNGKGKLGGISGK